MAYTVQLYKNKAGEIFAEINNGEMTEQYTLKGQKKISRYDLRQCIPIGKPYQYESESMHQLKEENELKVIELDESSDESSESEKEYAKGSSPQDNNQEIQRIIGEAIKRNITAVAKVQAGADVAEIELIEEKDKVKTATQDHSKAVNEFQTAQSNLASAQKELTRLEAQCADLVTDFNLEVRGLEDAISERNNARLALGQQANTVKKSSLADLPKQLDILEEKIKDLEEKEEIALSKSKTAKAKSNVIDELEKAVDNQLAKVSKQETTVSTAKQSLDAKKLALKTIYENTVRAEGELIAALESAKKMVEKNSDAEKEFKKEIVSHADAQEAAQEKADELIDGKIDVLAAGSDQESSIEYSEFVNDGPPKKAINRFGKTNIPLFLPSNSLNAQVGDPQDILKNGRKVVDAHKHALEADELAKEATKKSAAILTKEFSVLVKSVSDAAAKAQAELQNVKGYKNAVTLIEGTAKEANNRTIALAKEMIGKADEVIYAEIDKLEQAAQDAENTNKNAELTMVEKAQAIADAEGRAQAAEKIIQEKLKQIAFLKAVLPKSIQDQRIIVPSDSDEPSDEQIKFLDDEPVKDQVEPKAATKNAIQRINDANFAVTLNAWNTVNSAEAALLEKIKAADDQKIIYKALRIAFHKAQQLEALVGDIELIDAAKANTAAASKVVKEAEAKLIEKLENVQKAQRMLAKTQKEAGKVIVMMSGEVSKKQQLEYQAGIHEEKAEDSQEEIDELKAKHQRRLSLIPPQVISLDEDPAIQLNEELKVDDSEHILVAHESTLKIAELVKTVKNKETEILQANSNDQSKITQLIKEFELSVNKAVELLESAAKMPEVGMTAAIGGVNRIKNEAIVILQNSTKTIFAQVSKAAKQEMEEVTRKSNDAADEAYYNNLKRAGDIAKEANVQLALATEKFNQAKIANDALEKAQKLKVPDIKQNAALDLGAPFNLDISDFSESESEGGDLVPNVRRVLSFLELKQTLEGVTEEAQEANTEASGTFRIYPDGSVVFVQTRYENVSKSLLVGRIEGDVASDGLFGGGTRVELKIQYLDHPVVLEDFDADVGNYISVNITPVEAIDQNTYTFLEAGNSQEFTLSYEKANKLSVQQFLMDQKKYSEAVEYIEGAQEKAVSILGKMHAEADKSEPNQAIVTELTQEFANVLKKTADAKKIISDPGRKYLQSSNRNINKKEMADEVMEEMLQLASGLSDIANQAVRREMQKLKQNAQSVENAILNINPRAALRAESDALRAASIAREKLNQLEIINEALLGTGVIDDVRQQNSQTIIAKVANKRARIDQITSNAARHKTQATTGHMRFYADGSVVFVREGFNPKLVGRIKSANHSEVMNEIDVEIVYLDNATDFPATQDDYIQVKTKADSFETTKFSINNVHNLKGRLFLNEFNRQHKDELRIYTDGTVVNFSKDGAQPPQLIGHAKIYLAGYDISLMLENDASKTKEDIFSELFANSKNPPLLIKHNRLNGIPKYYIYAVNKNNQRKLKELIAPETLNELRNVPFRNILHEGKIRISNRPGTGQYSRTFAEIESKLGHIHFAGKDQKNIRLDTEVTRLDDPVELPDAKRNDPLDSYIKYDQLIEDEASKIIPFLNAYYGFRKIEEGHQADEEALEGLDQDSLKAKILRRKIAVNQKLVYYYANQYKEQEKIPETFDQLIAEKRELEDESHKMRAATAQMNSSDQLRRGQAKSYLNSLEQKHTERETREAEIFCQKTDLQNRLRNQPPGELILCSNGNVFFGPQLVGSWVSEKINGDYVIKINYGDQSELPNMDTFEVKFPAWQFSINKNVIEASPQALQQNAELAKLINARHEHGTAVSFRGKPKPTSVADVKKDFKNKGWTVYAEPNQPDRDYYSVAHSTHILNYKIETDQQTQATTETFELPKSTSSYDAGHVQKALLDAAASRSPIDEANTTVTFYDPMPGQAEATARRYQWDHPGVEIRFTDNDKDFKSGNTQVLKTESISMARR